MYSSWEVLTTVSVTETEGMLATFVPPKAVVASKTASDDALVERNRWSEEEEGPTKEEEEGGTDVLSESSDD